jgi:Icc-related predicted phosphoesterase
MKLTRLLHVADLHGSEMCFRKVVNSIEIYKPDLITVCGDLTGKGIVPIVQQSDGSFKSSFYDKAYELRSKEEVTKLVDKIRMNGWYEWHCTPSEIENFRASEEMQAGVFKQLIHETMKRWISFAAEALKGKKVRLFMLPGNDDDFVIDQPLNATGCGNIVNPEGKVVMIDDEHEMISTGYSNITPWHAERDIPEDELARKIEDMTSKVKNMKSAIFNFHCPPYGTMLDAAPKVDEKLRPVMSGGGVVIGPAGSTAVRAAIEKYQPLLGLHGHIHESRGLEKIGRTLCINPGSEYGEGILRGCIVNLGKDDVKSYLLTRG